MGVLLFAQRILRCYFIHYELDRLLQPLWELTGLNVESLILKSLLQIHMYTKMGIFYVIIALYIEDPGIPS